jgi:glycosyltransferase involved in cell wall biosynthesis
MRILIATDAFPPSCGGSGWSTYELARGLRQRGHHLVIVQPLRSAGAAYDGFDVIPFQAAEPPVPFVRNYFRNERLYRQLAGFLEQLIVRERIEIVHGQHLLTAPPSIRAARAAGIPSICTIRDYWPICYWGDLTRDRRAGGMCPECSVQGMTECVRPHAGLAWPLAIPWIPYMRANLAMKQHDLAGADAIVAVSRSVARDLRNRAPAITSTRLEVMPNAVDMARLSEARFPRPLDGPYALFVGKLSDNKGVASLVEVLVRARLDMPLVVVGDGPERAWLQQSAASANRDIRILGWLDRERVYEWMRHAQLMVFPSNWREPLSRVLLEASALGVPIAAMETGGTSDIVINEETGLLSHSIEELAADVTRLAADADLRARLGSAARERALRHFDLPVVLERVESLYEDLLAHGRAKTGVA